jgi:nucleotide-binding universal stress UspA family protein
MSGQQDGRVIVGVEDTPAGLRALRWAVAEARRRGVALHAVRTWRFSAGWQGADVGRYRREIATDAGFALVDAFATALGGIPNDVTVHALVLEGAPAPTLVRYADRDGDLIVVAASSRRWLPWLGVDARCLRRAGCPVVVVPAPALARAGSARALARKLRRETEQYVHAAGVPDRPVR